MRRSGRTISSNGAVGRAIALSAAFAFSLATPAWAQGNGILEGFGSLAPKPAPETPSQDTQRGTARLDGLDRRAAAPLAAMGNVTRQLCESGNARACEIFERLRRTALGMTAAQAACAGGEARACQLFELGVAEIAVAYRQFESAARASGGEVPDAPLTGPLTGPGGIFDKAAEDAER